MLSVPQRDVDRFWIKVAKSPDPDGCWLWIAGTFDSGYGAFRFHNRLRRTHRLAYEWLVGPIPDGSQVLHKCPDGGNRRCVNPAHLALGTHEENMRDRDVDGRTARGDRNGTRLHPERLARGERNGKHTKPERTPRGKRHPYVRNPERHAHGERVGASKLTADTVRIIRDRFAQGGITQTALAAEFGVTQMLVSKIVHRHVWKHVP